MSKKEFKVGDTIERLKDLCGVPKYTRGTVVKVAHDILYIDFHERYERTHKCNLLAEPTGLFVLPDDCGKVS